MQSPEVQLFLGLTINSICRVQPKHLTATNTVALQLRPRQIL
jgi:hypothetical protein